MQHFNIITRRGFLDRSLKLGLGVALSTLVDIPLVMKRALAEGTIGQGGKKLLFIFLRGANDGLNSVIPIQDPAYITSRPNIGIPADAATDYSLKGACDFPMSASAADPTFAYANAIRLGNGFMALHPSHKFLAPVYNAGHLALIHRVAYPQQSRSHFDSQNYWETGNPNNNLSKDGIFYRTLIESGLANTAPLTGVSIQSGLPLSLRGSAAAMTNLNDPTRYSLLGVPSPTGNLKAGNDVRAANLMAFPQKRNRDLLDLQYQNLMGTLDIFSHLDFTETGNTFKDDAATDNDTAGYYLFPTMNSKNGGYALHGNDPQKYVVDTGAYGFFNQLKSAALILNKTDAIIAGTEMGGFDTHSKQGKLTGTHPNLQRRIAWAMYGLRKYFMNYGGPANGGKVTWDNLVVITLSEFGRTTIENSDAGTDHAEANVMFVAGGAVKGYVSGTRAGMYGGSPSDSIPWTPGAGGSMFGASGRYLKRAVDYRSVLGEIIRDHLGATQAQVNRIIPGYAASNEFLQTGGTSGKDGTKIMGEVDVV